MNDTAAHKKKQESLSPEQKVKVMTFDSAAHKNNMSCFPQFFTKTEQRHEHLTEE